MATTTKSSSSHSLSMKQTDRVVSAEDSRASFATCDITPCSEARFLPKEFNRKREKFEAKASPLGRGIPLNAMKESRRSKKATATNPFNSNVSHKTSSDHEDMAGQTFTHPGFLGWRPPNLLTRVSRRTGSNDLTIFPS
jgi:hypothetical protein